MTRRSSSILGLAAAAILTLAACGGGTTSDAPATDPPASAPAVSDAPSTSVCTPSLAGINATVSMQGFAFDPGLITASVGDIIVWTNEDDVPHTATLTDDPACTTANLGNGISGGLTFSEAGTYAYFCKIHPDMTGTIEITG